MTRVRLDTGPEDRVRCMFCLESVPEVEYPGHVFHHHRISGLYLEGDGDGPGTCQESRYVQTGDEEILVGDSDKQSKCDEDLYTSSAVQSVASDIQLDCNSAEVRPIDDEDDDGEESDFELDCQCSFCLHADMEHDVTSATEDPSPDLQDTRTDNTPSILTELPRHESLEPTPKKVTFANITNYYPVKKLGWLDRLKINGGKNVKSQILGPNTSLKYLKHWGSSEKPPADPSELIRKRTKRKISCDIDVESVASLRSIGVAVVWHCPKDGCKFTGKNILTVRKHFSTHF